MTAIVFTPTGQGRCLHTDLIDLSQLGTLTIERASQVEFDSRLQAWRVRDLSGFPLFTAPTRQLCLEWERSYFERQEELKHKESP